MATSNPLDEGHLVQADRFIDRVREIADEMQLPFLLAVPGTESCPVFVYFVGGGCDGQALAGSLGAALGRIAATSSPNERARLLVQLEGSFWSGASRPLDPHPSPPQPKEPPAVTGEELATREQEEGWT